VCSTSKGSDTARAEFERFAPSPTLNQLLHGEADVASNLAKQGRSDIAAWMKRNRRAAPIGVSVLPMRASLPHLFKAEFDQESRNFARLQDRQ
jgi:hypothetical protein